MTATLRLRNRDFQLIGEIQGFEDFKASLRFNNRDAWSLTGWVPDMEFDRETMRGIVLDVDGTIILSGPIWSFQQVGKARSNTYTLQGFSDDFWMDARLALPVVTGPPYTASDQDRITTNAENMMHHYVGRNAGPLAKSERQVAGLTMAANQGRGQTFAGYARFNDLTLILNAISVANKTLGGDELGWRIVQVGNGIQFQVYVPVDRSATAKFSTEFGNLDAFDFLETGPRVNYAIVGGGGEGTARVFSEVGESVSMTKWGRVEQFVDQRSTSVATELAQKRDEVIEEGKGSTHLSVYPVDTSQLRYPTGYGLGDKVTVVVSGIPVVDLIREIDLNVKPTGVMTVIPKIGSSDMRGPVGFFRQLSEMRKRLGNLESR